MLLYNSTFIGIDPTSGHKSFTYAMLDRDLNLLALAAGEMEDVIAFIEGQKSVTVAVNAPAGVNLGLVRERLKKLLPTPHQIRSGEFRVAEFELRERGISVSGTPASAAISPAWMQLGFAMYRRLEKLGFRKYPAENEPYQIMETHPHACFCVMAGSVPLSKPSLEGKIPPMTTQNLETRAINALRFLSADGIQKANSGHPGLPMGAAAMAYTIWSRHLRHNPGNPKWMGRDRFLLSGGHGSMLLYSLLHLTGYDLSLDELKNFRQWGSITPGHPEYGLTPGVEMTTGPLGQGFASGVGMAIAATHLAAVYSP